MTKVTDQKLLNYCIVILTAVALTYSLIFTKSVLLPFVFSIFAYSVLSPFVALMQDKLKLPRFVVLIVTGLLILIGFLTVVFLLVKSMHSFIEGAGFYKEKLIELLEQLRRYAQSLGIDTSSNELKKEITDWPLLEWLKNLTGGLFSIVGNLFLVFIFSIFLLAGDQGISKKPKLFKQLQTKISRYVTTKFLVSAGTGILVWLVLVSFGVELAFMFAFLAFLLNFIPSIGSIIATIIPLPIILLQFGFGINLILILVLTGLIQLIIGNVLEPRLMGEAMDLHPVTILLFLMFWGLVWGVPGMFLAVPITAILRIILSRIEATQTLAGYLAGKY